MTTSTSASIWNFADQPEFAACLSRLRMLNGEPSRAARCDVLHDETGETAHSASVNGHRIRWTDEDAAVSLAWLGILPTCANCRTPYRGTGAFCGTPCALADKQISRDYQLDEVA